MRIVLWPMMVQALVNPTTRLGLPVLCRAVSQIVGDITSRVRTFAVTWKSSSSAPMCGQKLVHSAVAIGRRHRPAGEASLRPKFGNYLTI